MPPFIPAWDFQPIRLDNTPFDLFIYFNPCTKATSEMGKEKKRYNRNRRGKGGREIEKEKLR